MASNLLATMLSKRPSATLTTWASRARETVGDPFCGWQRSPSMASDCSGMGTAELAWNMLSKFCAHPMRHEFVCDNDQACQTLLGKLLPGVPVLTDMRVRVFKGSCWAAVTTNGQRIVMRRRGAGELDLYVAGTSCASFSVCGGRDGFQAEASHTFFAALKTITAMRPRAAILENVKGILDRNNVELCRKSLNTLSGYCWREFVLESSQYGVPHHRVRVYFVLLQVDAVKHSADESLAMVQLQMAKMHSPCRQPWPQWLSQIGLPMQVSTSQVAFTITLYSLTLLAPPC